MDPPLDMINPLLRIANFAPLPIKEEIVMPMEKNVETVPNLITLQNVVHQALKQSNMLNATLQILMKIMQLIIHFLLEVLLLILQ